MKPTRAVLRGIEAACSSALAGPIGDGGDFTDRDGEDIEAALAWARARKRADSRASDLETAEAIVRDVANELDGSTTVCPCCELRKKKNPVEHQAREMLEALAEKLRKIRERGDSWLHIGRPR